MNLNKKTNDSASCGKPHPRQGWPYACVHRGGGGTLIVEPLGNRESLICMSHQAKTESVLTGCMPDITQLDNLKGLDEIDDGAADSNKLAASRFIKEGVVPSNGFG